MEQILKVAGLARAPEPAAPGGARGRPFGEIYRQVQRERQAALETGGVTPLVLEGYGRPLPDPEDAADPRRAGRRGRLSPPPRP